MNTMHLKTCIIVLFLSACCTVSHAQNIGIKTNLIYDVTSTINLGVEVGIAPKWTIDLSGNLNAWSDEPDGTWKHYLVQPEARYWLCDRFSGHFFGAHLLGGAFNLAGLPKIEDFRYQGYAYGAGVAYGFAAILGKHFNLEFELGLGYAFLDYERYECYGCGKFSGTGQKNYFGPTKAAISLVYLF